MKIKTRKFGEIEIDDDKIIFMPEGLPGFSGFDRFVLLEDPKIAPFCWFQSTDEPNLALVLMDPVLFQPDYQLGLEKFINDRNWTDLKKEDIAVYVVINISGKGADEKITANLVGPIVINSKAKEAVQVVITDSSYSYQYDIIKHSDQK